MPIESTEASAKIRPALSPPAACSSCGGQYVDRQHVDFNAAFDGGFYGGEGSTRVAIDDLVICDECIRAAAALLGLVDPEEVSARAAELEERLAETSEKLAGALVVTATLERTLAEREKLEDLLRPKARSRR